MTRQGFFTLERIRQWIGNFLFTLFFLAVMVDPTNTVLGLKSKLFALLLVYNVVAFKPSFRFLPHILAPYTALTLAYMLSLLQGNAPDFDAVVDTYVAFVPLFLLPWVHHYNLVRLSLFPAVTVAVVVCLIYAFSSYDESFEGAIFFFMKQHNDMVMMTHRYLLGVRVFGIYYKSFACLCIPLFWFYYTLYNKHSWQRWLSILPATLLTFAFLVSGTRATMLLPFFMIALVSYKRFAMMRKGKYFLYPVLAAFFLCFLLLVLTLASEKTESSNAIKYAHLTSYMNLFEQHPLYLLLGQGPGTSFYSEGFHKLTNATEWTYIELIRQYGLTGLLVLFLLLYPFYALWKHRSNDYLIGIMGAYMAYLLIAGTNPLLFSSTGMQIVLCAYSIVARYDIPVSTGRPDKPSLN